SGPVEEDPITKQVQAAVDVLSKNAGTVVVDQQYYKTKTKKGVAQQIQERVEKGETFGDFDDLSVSKQEYEAEFANERARMATIKNPNVIINNVGDQMCSGGRCYFFNRNNLHSYYGDQASHLTSEGVELLGLRYGEIIEDFLRKRRE
ncbi:hypothetical protein PFISCL1PPCAC_25276, partial [Pristionchus fissidentatus]